MRRCWLQDSGMTLRVTIDTNCINVKQAHFCMNQIEDIARRGKIKLTTTFAISEDLDFDKTQFSEARRTKALRLPMARSGFMIGHSMVGGPDVIGGPNVYEHVDSIAEIIVPATNWEDIHTNSQRDILHLAGHLTYGWELFVTEDKGILKHALKLAELGVEVLTPQETLQYLKDKGIF